MHSGIGMCISCELKAASMLYRNGQTITSSSSDTSGLYYLYARAAQDAASAAAAAATAYGQPPLMLMICSMNALCCRLMPLH